MITHQNSFGDLVTYIDGEYAGMAFKDTDGCWCAVAARDPKDVVPCLSREHAQQMVLFLLAADFFQAA